MDAPLRNLTIKDLVRLSLLGFVPWGPAVLFERATFLAATNGSSLYATLTGLRLFVDVASFGLGGILIAYLLRPRLATLQVFLSSLLTWALFYQICPGPFHGGFNGLLHSECYLPGPDGLSGYRLGLLLFSLGALPSLVKAAPVIELSSTKQRLPIAVLAGTLVSVVLTWFPMTAWFSGVSYVQPLFPIQVLVFFGLPAVASGMLAARIGRSVWIAPVAGVFSLLFLTLSLWGLLCPGCDRSLLSVSLGSWAVFGWLGGFLELGPHGFQGKSLPAFLVRSIPSLGQVALAAAITVSIMTLLASSFWEPTVLYAASATAQGSPSYLGLPTYRPYIAGYYDSSQYRICCLEIGVRITSADTSQMGPGNFLMAGMGVQSPNCCLDGWDFGWRADVYLLRNGTLVVSGSSWETCDSNPDCGGYFWQHLRFHAQHVITPPARSTPIYLRMMWESGQANWYYNYTRVPWTRFGTFTPDSREGIYFDIGVVGSSGDRNPYHRVYFYQFGVASNAILPGWTITLLHPSFQLQGTWRAMEKAAVVQGDLSLWKGSTDGEGPHTMGSRPKPIIRTLPWKRALSNFPTPAKA